MEHLLDALGLVSNLSIHILAPLAVLGIVLSMKHLRKLLKQHEEVIGIIQAWGKASIDENGNLLFDPKAVPSILVDLQYVRAELENHNAQTLLHYNDTSRLASQEHWKTCEISRCVHLQTFINQLDKIIDRLNQFDRRADETRSNTTMSLEGLREGQRELGKDLGKELGDLGKLIINVLAEDLKRR